MSETATAELAHAGAPTWAALARSHHLRLPTTTYEPALVEETTP